MIKVGLLGFGKTGRAVASVLLESELVDLRWIVRKSKKLEHRSISEYLGIPSDGQGLFYSSEKFTAHEILNQMPVDVIIDFSSQDGIDYYLKEAQLRQIKIITAISEYSDDKLQKIKEASEFTTIISSPNITVGINFLLIAAKILRQIAPYADIEIIEEHFKQKPEVSGTSKILANNLGIDDKNIKSIRAGGIVGRHEILFGFPYQTVRLQHESISREAFGSGILFALKNLPDSKSGLFTMQDLMEPYFKVS